MCTPFYSQHKFTVNFNSFQIVFPLGACHISNSETFYPLKKQLRFLSRACIPMPRIILNLRMLRKNKSLGQCNSRHLCLHNGKLWVCVS